MPMITRNSQHTQWKPTTEPFVQVDGINLALVKEFLLQSAPTAVALAPWQL